jgi:hypothetical protein
MMPEGVEPLSVVRVHEGHESLPLGGTEVVVGAAEDLDRLARPQPAHEPRLVPEQEEDVNEGERDGDEHGTPAAARPGKSPERFAPVTNTRRRRGSRGPGPRFQVGYRCFFRA